MLAEHFARELLGEVPARPGVMLAVDAIDPLEEERNPSEARLGQRKLTRRHENQRALAVEERIDLVGGHRRVHTLVLVRQLSMRSLPSNASTSGRHT